MSVTSIRSSSLIREKRVRPPLCASLVPHSRHKRHKHKCASLLRHKFYNMPVYMPVTSIRSSSHIRNIFHLSFESSDTSGFSLLNTTTVLGVLNFNSLLSNLAATVLPFFIFSSNS